MITVCILITNLANLKELVKEGNNIFYLDWSYFNYLVC